jgi:hypothetical protein
MTSDHHGRTLGQQLCWSALWTGFSARTTTGPTPKIPVARLVADPADLAVQHRVLVPEHHEFGVLGHLTPGQHHERAEQTANEQVDNRRRSLSDDPNPAARPGQIQ